MNFEQLCAAFEQAGGGSESYKALSKGALDLIEQDPANAAVYFLVATIARSYVLRYEEWDVTMDFAEKAQQVMAGFVRRLDAALQEGPLRSYAVLSEVAAQYELHTPDF